MNKRTVFVFLALTIFSAKMLIPSTVFLRITKNLQEKAEIAVLFSGGSDDYWNAFSKTISRDLDYSGYFSVSESKFADNLDLTKKRYPTELVFLGERTKEGIKVVLEDMLDEKILFEKGYGRAENAPEYLAHKICDDIVLHLTGKPGIAKSRILFVSNSTGRHQLYQVDYDGENTAKLTDAGHLVHYPKWLVPHKEIVFVSYLGGWPKLVKKDITAGSEKIILAEPGLNACASPCRATKEMAVVMSRTGRPEIYITDFDGEIINRVTYSKATDASPSFSPCGKMIAFVSDRHGFAQIYTMTREGSRVRRISYVAGYSTSPAWSPDGNYIAYVFMRGGDFGIAVYEIASGETKIIGEALGSEDLSWGADSRHIVYSNMKSRPASIVVLDIITGEKRQLTVGLNAFSPNWSVLDY